MHLPWLNMQICDVIKCRKRRGGGGRSRVTMDRPIGQTNEHAIWLLKPIFASTCTSQLGQIQRVFPCTTKLACQSQKKGENTIYRQDEAIILKDERKSALLLSGQQNMLMYIRYVLLNITEKTCRHTKWWPQSIIYILGIFSSFFLIL